MIVFKIRELYGGKCVFVVPRFGIFFMKTFVAKVIKLKVVSFRRLLVGKRGQVDGQGHNK